jgi:NADH-quinone oxidoreductase subunit G
MFQKLARMVLGSPNIDSSLRWSPEAVESFISVSDMPFGGVSVFDCVNADTLLIIGGNLTEENPVTDYIVRRVSGQRRMNVIIAGVRGMRLDSSANVSVRHLPGAEGAFLGAVTSALADQTDDALLKIAGVTADEVNAVAGRMKASESIAVIAGTDFLRFPHGIAGLGALKEALKKSGKKVMITSAFDRANQRGAWEMGVHPGLAPGYRKAEEKGLGSEAMLKGAVTGDIEALYLNGADVISGYCDEEAAREALSKVKFLVVQDSFMTETAKLAHVVLPSSTFAENDGTLTNQEGRVQLIKRLLPPPGVGKSGVGVIGNVGRAFISSFGPKGASAVFEEITKEVSGYAGVNLLFNNKKNVLNRLDNKEALVKNFSAPNLAVHGFAPASVEGADEAGSMLLVTGNHLFHSGKLSMRSTTLTELLKAAVVELSTEDVTALGLKNGDKVCVKGNEYEAVLTLRANAGTRRGVAFIAENFEDVPVRKFLKRRGAVARVIVSKA